MGELNNLNVIAPLLVYMYALAYLVIGALSGIISGLLGVGGGVLIVPALFFLFSLQGFPVEHVMSMAIANSLAIMAFSSGVSTFFHAKKYSVLWKIVLLSSPGILLGCGCGALIATSMPTMLLQKVFGGSACVIGFYLAKHMQNPSKKQKMPRFFLQTFLSFGVSSLASTLGVGGGMFVHPYLITRGFPPPKAIGTSSAFSFVISLYGALAYYAHGEGLVLLPNSLGYIYLPAFISISFASALCARQGVILAHKLNPKTIRKAFAAMLVVIGTFMLLR